MITQTPQGGYYLGKEGGILNAIVGSLYLAGGATLLAFLLSLPVALYLNVYSTARRHGSFPRAASPSTSCGASPRSSTAPSASSS